MGRQLIQARVPNQLAEEIEEYQESGGYMNQSEAVRTLLRAGLEAETETSNIAAQAGTVLTLIVGFLLGTAAMLLI